MITLTKNIRFVGETLMLGDLELARHYKGFGMPKIKGPFFWATREMRKKTNILFPAQDRIFRPCDGFKYACMGNRELIDQKMEAAIRFLISQKWRSELGRQGSKTTSMKG